MPEQSRGLKRTQKSRSPRNVPFAIANPEAQLSDVAIDALARLLLSLKRRQVDQQEDVVS